MLLKFSNGFSDFINFNIHLSLHASRPLLHIATSLLASLLLVFAVHLDTVTHRFPDIVNHHPLSSLLPHFFNSNCGHIVSFSFLLHLPPSSIIPVFNIDMAHYTSFQTSNFLSITHKLLITRITFSLVLSLILPYNLKLI